MPATTPKKRQAFSDDTPEAKGADNGYQRPVFVRCDLSTDQKKEMAEWANAHTADDLLDLVNESVSDGYTVSFKTADIGYQASLTQGKKAAVGIPNIGKSLVTRASTPERAIWSLYYKHTQVLEKDWGNASESQLEW